MGHRRLTLCALWVFTAALLPAEGDFSVAITQYRYENYIRHPRMEEEDRLRGRTFVFGTGLEIISNIDDVEISIFGEKVGRTPWESGDLAPGSYRVLLNRRGFTTREMWVQVIADRRIVVVVDLPKSTGTLRLRHLPENAEAAFNRVPLNGDIGEVNAGPGLLVVNAFGWETVEELLEVPADGELVWDFKGTPTPFALGDVTVTPKSLPPDDNRGFRIRWNAAAPGIAKLSILDGSGRTMHSTSMEISSPRGKSLWIPRGLRGLLDGTYTVKITGTDRAGNRESTQTRLRIDSRFKRSPRTIRFKKSGLMYAPGAAMLPPGIWQAATGVNADIGDAAPVFASVRFSPAARWEFQAGFTVTVRDPFDTTGIGFSLAGSWRMTPRYGPFAANLSLAFSYTGLASAFAAIPSSSTSPDIPGLQFSIPMELTIRRWSFILTPSADATLLGPDSANRRPAAPLRLLGSLSAGIYYESPGLLIGISETLRSPDLPGGFFDWMLQTGLNGRIDLPGDSSYIGLSAGLGALPGTPRFSLGLEFGVIR